MADNVWDGFAYLEAGFKPRFNDEMLEAEERVGITGVVILVV